MGDRGVHEARDDDGHEDDAVHAEALGASHRHDRRRDQSVRPLEEPAAIDPVSEVGGAVGGEEEGTVAEEAVARAVKVVSEREGVTDGPPREGHDGAHEDVLEEHGGLVHLAHAAGLVQGEASLHEEDEGGVVDQPVAVEVGVERVLAQGEGGVALLGRAEGGHGGIGVAEGRRGVDAVDLLGRLCGRLSLDDCEA